MNQTIDTRVLRVSLHAVTQSGRIVARSGLLNNNKYVLGFAESVGQSIIPSVYIWEVAISVKILLPTNSGKALSSLPLSKELSTKLVAYTALLLTSVVCSEVVNDFL